jgi:hypothetical protein
VNTCTSCGEDFGSVSAFDAHRIGNYPQRGPSEYTGTLADWVPRKGRRCLTVEELLARGWLRDGRGRWRQPSDGAPWAASQDQVTTKGHREVRGKGHGRHRLGGRSAPLPASRKEPTRQ